MDLVKAFDITDHCFLFTAIFFLFKYDFDLNVTNNNVAISLNLLQ